MDSVKTSILKNPHALTAAEIAFQLNVDSNLGLTNHQIKSRLQQFGKNEIPQQKKRNKWRIFIEQFLNSIIFILAVATLLSFLFSDWREGIAIIIVILITVFIGFFMELQAHKSLEKLRKLGLTHTTVLRNGKIKTLKSYSLVPGDILMLGTGDVVAADARLIFQENLSTKEAALTGESNPIEKQLKPIPEKTPIASQNNMVFKGTLITKGNGKAIVTSTGKHTQLGKIQLMGLQVEKSKTPLEKKLQKLSKSLIWITISLTFLITIIGIIRGIEFLLMLQTGLALAVASIPEGLPIVATIALAQGMLKLSKQNIIVKNLEAVHTLGATNLICTDKTGTVTEDKMSVNAIIIPSHAAEQLTKENIEKLTPLKSQYSFNQIINTGILCNDIKISEDNKRLGDPMDQALLEFASLAGYNTKNIIQNNPQVKKIPFDSEIKMMATTHKNKHHFTVYVKGAFESVSENSNFIHINGEKADFNNKNEWLEKVDYLASQGLRVLAFAMKESEKIPDEKNMLTKLTFLGLIGFLDMAREDVKDTITTYKNAGIRVVMITGDHPETAKKIARDVGLLQPNTSKNKVINGAEINQSNAQFELDKLQDTVIFARVIPKQKLDIITMFQQNNNIVGMIGDGINDIPALKKADIGIAMGIRGTEAARETADMILKDDKFTSIELAIRQGRAIYENIQQFVVYLLSSNLAEIVSVAVAAILNLPSPLLPLQILFLNLITDIFPALALGMGKGSKNIMNKPPRNPSEPIMTKILWKATLFYGLGITAGVLGITSYSYYILNLEPTVINNLAFYTLIFAQLLNIFNLPKRNVSFFKNEITQNPWVWGALALCIIITVVTYFTGAMANALSLIKLPANYFILVFLFGAGSLVITQFFKRIRLTD